MTRPAELVTVVEVMVAKLSDPGLDLSLHLIGRLERAVLAGHTSNLLRLEKIEERVLAADELTIDTVHGDV